MNKKYFICRIWQKTNFAFAIEWNDGKIQTFRLDYLQQQCPCAKCGEKSSEVDRQLPNVKAKFIQNVGRYGLRIQFTSGCSKGIYNLHHLYEMKTEIETHTNEIKND